MNNYMYMLSGMFLFLLSLIFLVFGMNFIMNDYLIMLDWEIISINSVNMVMTLLFDWMSLLFMSCVLLISSMVVFYSHSYMHSDMNKLRFLSMVLLFILSMMMMILSPNLVSILLGWDGLGLVSYALVIYFQNYSSYSAGMLTILTNRIGDVAILLGIGLMFNFGSWHYIYYVQMWDNSMCMLFILVVLAAFTSSAQIPFSSWLPAAMAAPTPVSALVHSSTLVTAGVYLLIRFSNVFAYYDCSLLVMMGMMTMFMAGLGASFEFDLKSIIALSTLSQLGLMMGVLFMGLPMLAFFHLLTHAFFKALLFLCAGLIIHLMSDSQDIRCMGGVIKYIPYTCACFCISNVSLCGLPFMAGFYSKDLALESLSFSYYNLFVYIVFYVSVGLTSMYTMRMLYYCLYGYVNMYPCQGYIEDNVMIYPMSLLTLLSVLSGSLLSWLIFPFPSVICLDFLTKISTLVFIFMGFVLGSDLMFSSYTTPLYSMLMYKLSNFLGDMWFMPRMSTYMIYDMSMFLSLEYSAVMDMGWGEYLVSNALYKYSTHLSGIITAYQNNNIKYMMLTFLVLLITLLV
uniref:NADH-ubiquinone oxidoreductase chain 5 n=1 Tax=Nabicula flavomarginata TaxID=1656685 RepID=A0A343ISB9_9HEMI|nr:NADH dehydrogenase subunit 5 [Nabicula flavomarginata]AST10131.1 NADH dehydrogenase subunit 5 [Nabicula flavomarginata]